MSVKPRITGTAHILPFEKLSPDSFERLCLWLLRREGFGDVEHLGAAGSDQGRDIVATASGRRWAFQCKRVSRFGPSDAIGVIDRILSLPSSEHPDRLVFLATCDISSETRRRCREHYAGFEYEFWSRTELDERLKRHPDLLDEFFQLAPDRWAPGVNIVAPGEAGQVNVITGDGSTIDQSTTKIFVVDGRVPESPQQAFDSTAHGDMLRRERLSKEDFERGQAVRPPLLGRIEKALKERKSFAVEGAPGSGKSSLAAWANWIALHDGQRVAAFFGRKLQHKSAHEACLELGVVPADHLVIIDDIQLIEPALARLKSLPWSADRQFMLLGRSDYVETAMLRGGVPKMDEELIRITDEDSQYVAEELASKYLRGSATELLRRTGRDLVLTKWTLEAVVLDGADPDCTPTDAAMRKLSDLRKDAGEEALRLFLVLAAFGWTELPCPESFLSDMLGFGVSAIEDLHERLEEAQRYTGTSQEESGYAVRLRRHPRLCRLFLDSAPTLGQAFRAAVVAPTCNALATDPNSVESLGFSSLVLGRALVAGIADVDTIEWRLKYATRSRDFRDVVMAAVQFLLAEHGGPGELPLEEEIRRLKFAFAAANAERRVHYATAAQSLLRELREQLGVPQIPDEPFWDKGYILYQLGYLHRLNDAFDDAIALFEESASADDEYAKIQNSDVHRGKASMSRIVAAACQTECAVFAPTEGRPLEPNREELQSVMDRLSSELAILEEVLNGAVEDRWKRMLQGFRSNALLHLAEVAGWLGIESDVKKLLASFEACNQRSIPTDDAIGLAKGALGLALRDHDEVVRQLEGQPQRRVELGSGEGAGKAGVMLVLAYVELGQHANAKALNAWLLSDECPVDAGNRLAKTWLQEWTARRGPI